MAYRGEDLDLRLPQPRGARETYVSSDFALNGTRPRAPLATASVDPVFVDDTVMACCNHAYDIAQAHGASEVRLEHLVHALTRVEAAADILEERGIREAHLRRESAAVIASEIPVGLAHSQSAPRASAEFEDVLRRASDLAAGRPGNQGATVHDLLWVLLNYNRDIPAIALLLRHAAGWQSWDWPNRAPARDMIREEPRRREVARPVERVVERRPSRVPPQPAYAPEPRFAQNGSYGADVQARFDQLEQSMRTMQAEMAADRRALMDLVRDLQRDVQNAAGSAASEPGVVVEHLRAVEANVEDRLGELARTATALNDRLHSLEKSVSGTLQEGSRNWTAVGDRLSSLDQAVSANANTGLADLVTEQLVTVSDQVRLIAQRLEAVERGQGVFAGVGERLRGMDDKLDAQRRDVQTMLSAQNPAAMQTFASDVKGHLDQSKLELTSAMALAVEPLSQRVQQFEGASVQRLTEARQQIDTVGRRVADLDTSVKSQIDAGRANLDEVHDALVKLGVNQQTLAGNLEQWRLESGGDLGIISNRLELLERGSGQPLELLGQLQTDMQALQQVALADYDHNRRGFKQWLFGTDDIFASSWLDETSALRARLKSLREGRKV